MVNVNLFLGDFCVRCLVRIHLIPINNTVGSHLQGVCTEQEISVTEVCEICLVRQTLYIVVSYIVSRRDRNGTLSLHNQTFNVISSRQLLQPY